ncbi:MAG: pilus assembly protein N-terminal domain-containing protein, partial [Burkholderiaceae bacterium]
GDAEVATERIQLSVGQAHLVRERAVRRIVVGSGRVIQVTALDSGQILVLAEAPGQSTVQLWGPKGVRRQLAIVVVERDTARIADEVAAMLGSSPTVTSRVVGDLVVLEGEQPSEDEVNRIVEVQKRFPQVMSLVSRAGFERMVRMEVRMLEIGRNALERLGVQWQSGRGTPFAIDGPSFGLIGDFKRSDAFLPGGAAETEGFTTRPRVRPFATAASIASSLTSMIDLLVQSGEAAILAEPRLSCRSGGSARFVAGGELPIPVIAANGAASVQFKEYGVRFEVSPVVNAAGMIAATLQAEISSINPDVRVRDIPGLRKQSASTQVNLVEGQTLVIAGMLSNEISGSIDKIPALGDLPILGRLFRSRRFQDRETEMVVLITPRLQEQVLAADTEQRERVDERLRTLRRSLTMEE